MSYIAVYFKLLKRSFFLVVSHILLLLLVALSPTQTHRIRQYAEDFFRSSTDEEPAHFYTVLDNRADVVLIIKKMSSLPGIEDVSVVPLERMKETAQRIRSQMKSLGIEGRIPKLSGLKIVFQKEVGRKSMELIRSYIKRLAGDGASAVGAVNMPQQATIRTARIGIWAVVFLCLIWFAVNASIAKKIREGAYIIEQFQRRRSVAFKTYCGVLCIPFFIPLIGGAILLPISLSAVVLVLATVLLGSIHYKREQWQGF